MLYVKNLVTGQITNHSDYAGGTFELRFNELIFLDEDGSSITFDSGEPVVPDVNFRTQIYRKDLASDSFTLITTGIDGLPGNDTSDLSDVSDNGRYVAFISEATNLTNDVLTTVRDQVFVRDTQTGTTTLITRQPDGTPSAFDDFVSDYDVSVSNSGSVVFAVGMNDLVETDTNGLKDLFYADPNGLITRINLTPAGNEVTDAFPRTPEINGAGTDILYTSSSDQLVDPIIETVYSQLFHHDLSTAMTRRITSDQSGQPGNRYTSTYADIATDGSRAVFTSDAFNLPTESVNGRHQTLYALNLNNHQLVHLSTALFDPMTADGNVYWPKSSDDQLTIIYSSSASNLTDELIDPTPDDFNFFVKLYLLDRNTNTHQIIGNRVFGIHEISPSGRFVVFASSYAQPDGMLDLGENYLFLYDRQSDEYSQIAVGIRAEVTNDGLVSFVTDEAFDSGDTNDFDDVYVFNPATSQISLVSQNSAGNAVGSGFSDIGGAGNDTWVAFSSGSDELVPSDTNGLLDVFLKKWPNGPIIRASATPAGLEGDGISWIPKISGDGTRVVFTSEAQNLTNDDYSEADNDQLLAYDRINQSIHLVTRNDAGEPITEGTSFIYDNYDISTSGRYVAYEYEDSVIDVPDFEDDTDGRPDVLLYDLDMQNTQVISQYLEGFNRNSTDDSERPHVVEDLSQNPPLLGVVFQAQGGQLTGWDQHPGRYDEIIMYQQGGDDLILTVHIQGPGRVTGSSGINCTTNCQYVFPLGVDLSLIAEPDPDAEFIAWQAQFGGCVGNENPCNLTIDRTKSITAVFRDNSDVVFVDGFE